MTRRVFIFAAILFGAVLSASAHPFRWKEISFESSWWTFCVATLGLVLALPQILRGSGKARFTRGLIFGFVFFSCVFYWVAYALYTFGNVGIWISLVGVGSLALYCGIYWGLWALICGSHLVKSRPVSEKIIAWGAAYAALEAARQWIITGFPWGELGHAFSFSPLIARTASVWGIHGLSFFWICLVAAIIHIKHEEFRSEALRIIAGILISILSCSLLVQVQHSIASDVTDVRIGTIQPNIAQDLKWDPAEAYNNLKKLIELSTTIESEDISVILWPETAYPFSISKSETTVPMNFKVPLIFGAVVHEDKSSRNAVVLSNQGQILSYFSKIHLVPFGEYVPLANIIPFGKVVQNVADFKPGAASQQPFELPFELNSPLKVGPLVCYEDIFSRSSVNLARKGSQLLLNFTNDAWYGPSSALEQHAAMAHMQVFQTGLPMIRSTNNGMTTALSWDEAKSLPMFSEKAGVLTVDVPLTSKPKLTFFVWTYPLMEWIWFFIFAIAVLWKSPRSKRKIFFQKSSPY